MLQRKKYLFRGLTAVLALMLCFACIIGETWRATAEEELEIVSSYPYTTVTKVKVNLRASRSVKSELLTRIPEGAEITVTEKNGNWAHVEYKKYKGWVRTEYIVLKQVKKIKVTPSPTPIPTLTPEEDAGGYNVLKKGSSGGDVKSLQEALIELGYMTGEADGNFGAATEKAVIAFQQKNGYPDTGLVDANLQAFLYSGKPLNAKGVATKINTLSPVSGVTMRLNNTGWLVGELQQKLKELGYYNGTINNKYNTETKKAVAAFQKKNGLTSDGLAGAETRELLNSGTGLPADATATPKPTASPTPTPEPSWDIPTSTVKNGSSGDDAKKVQTRLQELGYYRGNLDGKFGRASVNALKSFQTNNGLKADGIAGESTYDKLFSVDAIPFSVETPAATTETATPAPASEQGSSIWTTLRSGMTGDDVTLLQENLIELGYLTGKATGIYDTNTVNAVKAFQKANGLTSDGVAGASTQKKLYSGSAKASTSDSSTSGSSTGTTSGSLKRGSTGSEVKSLQTKLIELGYLTGTADGIFGRKTAAAVKSFQKANKLTVDGVAGAKTLAKLESSSKETATASPTSTPAPTAVPGASDALSGNPKASQVIYANWYTTVKAVCKKYPYVTVYDFVTGISWQVHIFSVGAHADCEPVTANDTARMNRAFGGETTWNPKAVWVIFSDGSVYIGSTHNTPHGTSHISDNNFGGHTCIHFPRTQEEVSSIGQYATSHQDTIDAGWTTTQNMR